MVERPLFRTYRPVAGIHRIERRASRPHVELPIITPGCLRSGKKLRKVSFWFEAESISILYMIIITMRFILTEPDIQINFNFLLTEEEEAKSEVQAAAESELPVLGEAQIEMEETNASASEGYAADESEAVEAI